MKTKKFTRLCVGPMSKNCIDATIEISNEKNIEMILIASRRQIEAEEFGCGYVENYSTEKFSEYIRGQKSSNISLARDHGGPWQGNFEIQKNLNVEQSMLIAKKSFVVDIDSGFRYIHIDPSIPINSENLTATEIQNRLFELYGFLNEYALLKDIKLTFELGTEEQNGYGQDLEKFENFLNAVSLFCKKNRFQMPGFVVAQTGTKVMETKNIGFFGNDEFQNDQFSLEKIYETISICRKYGVKLKEHNTDYLSDSALALRPYLGIDSSNVAPEFGVVETRALLYVLRMNKFNAELNEFIEIANNSGKWKKWLIKGKKYSDIEKAIISGHYVFSNDRIHKIKEEVARQLNIKGFDLDHYLKTQIKSSIMRYLQLFNRV
ncbi:MAG: hypothetical protein MI717_11905 [Spirochaetales bacterium]|nr:hypothetical protein [Spirochaetales bacterium]